MTNKEAIHELEIMLKNCDYDEQFEALDLAIKALEKVDGVNPCSNCQEFDCYGCKVKETEE